MAKAWKIRKKREKTLVKYRYPLKKDVIGIHIEPIKEPKMKKFLNDQHPPSN
jgi:hypothetical protein